MCRPIRYRISNGIELKTKDGKLSEAQVEIRYRRLRILPPEGKRKRCPALELTVIHAMETGKPKAGNR